LKKALMVLVAVAGIALGYWMMRANGAADVANTGKSAAAVSSDANATVEVILPEGGPPDPEALRASAVAAESAAEKAARATQAAEIGD
jgi:hypothetical protein